MRHLGPIDRMGVLALFVFSAWTVSVPGQELRHPAAFDSTTSNRDPSTRLPLPGVSTRLNQGPALTTLDGPSTSLSGPTAIGRLVEYALANNPEIQAARFHAQALGARVPQARSLPDPTLMTTVFLEEIQTAAGSQQVAMSLSQKFPWFCKRDLRSQVAYHSSMAAYSRVAATELKVVEQVKRTYFDLYFTQNAIKETYQLEKPLEDVIDVAKSRYDSSMGKLGLESVFQAQVELAKLKTELVKMEEAKHQAQARLARVMHLPPGTPIQALDTIDRRNVESKVETLVGLADTFQPEFEAYHRELARERAAVDLARREYWPDVTTSFNWYEMGSSGLSPVSNGRDAFSIGIGVNLPIQRGRLHAAVREAENELCATARRYDATRDRFESEIETLLSQFREHYQTLEILEKEIVPRAEETLELTLESYGNGRADFQQLIDIYRTLLHYRVDLHRHLALTEQALASLERSVGCAITSQTTPSNQTLGSGRR